jgi:hypothetical protein
MQLAIAEAKRARDRGDYAIGAVITQLIGNREAVIAWAGNRVKTSGSSIKHVELETLKYVSSGYGRYLPDFLLYSSPSETWRPLARHAEAAFESDPDPPQRPFVEELADQRDAVGHATRRGKLRQRMVWIRRPVAARLRHFDKARTQCK